MSKKIFQIILIFSLLFIIIFLLRGGENAWVCENGEWIKQGSPAEPKPITPCPVKETELIKLFSPQAGQEITTPLEITGEARGTWFFEADFPVYILNEQREVIAQGIAQAQDDWMTENFIPFKATIDFPLTGLEKGFLVLKKDNPSGLKEYDDQIEIPILFASSEEVNINVYFSHQGFSGELFCNKVFPLKRKIFSTKSLAETALQELLKGTTIEEEAQEYFTHISQEAEVQSLIISQGLAQVDFNDSLLSQVNNDCQKQALKAQIEETLKQFSFIDQVIISINGQTESIF